MPTIDGNPAEIVAVRDGTRRNLLLEPEPLVITRLGTATVEVEIGPGSPMQIGVAADQPWLQFDRATLDLEAGATAELRLAVLPDGAEEFAVLRLGWKAGGEDFAEHILIWRQTRRAKPDQPPPATESPPLPSTGTTPLPDWLKAGGP